MHPTKIEDMQAIIDVIPNPVFIKDRNHRMVLLNAAACAFFGHSREALLRYSDDLFPPEQVRVFHRADEAVFSSGKEYENEERVTDAAGNVRTVITRKRRVTLGDEDFLVAACADVTPYREADRDRYFDLSLDLLCIATPDGYFKNVNPAFRAALGWSEEELLARPFVTLVHPEDRLPTLRQLKLLRTGRATELFENRYRCRNGGYRWLAWKVVPAPDGLLYGAARDVTDAKAAHDVLAHAKLEAEAASRAKSAFLATMSHEIRTPMNGVLGMIEVLERTELSRDQLEMTRTVRDSAGALLAIIDDILDFSKIEAGRLELEREPVSLVDMVEGLSSTLVPVATRKNVRLGTFVSPAMPDRVLSDDTRLRQLLYNLVGNAIKFSGGRAAQQGRVSIEVEVAQADPLRVAFKVNDNGIGMSADTLAHLFVPFTQGEVSTTRRFGGTGLGLAICRRLVELMHGEITVTSEPGLGSCFVVELPFEPAPAAVEDSAKHATENPHHDLQGVGCLIVESPTFEADYLRRYAEHAQASARIAQADALVPQAVLPGGDPLVVVHDGRTDWRARFREAGIALPHAELVIVPGHRGTARVESPHRVVLGADGLRRQTFLHGLAITAGRAAPWSQRAEPRDAADAVRFAPGIAEARALGRLVLIAEDDEINQKVILRQLSLLGYAAEVACNGRDALELWRENRYMMLLTDLHMPEMDGYQLAAAIRQEEQGQRMPIVALTANAVLGEASRAKAAGMNGYLTKPLQLDALKAALEACLDPLPPAGASADAVDTSAAIATPRPLVDFSVLSDLIGDDIDTMRELVGDYLESLRELCGEIRARARDGRVREVGALAHRLKSSSRSVGALDLGDLCNELENAGRAEDHAAMLHWLGKFELAMPEVEGAIERFLAGGS